MSPSDKRLPSLSTIAGRAMSQLSKRAIAISVVICLSLATLGAVVLIRPLQNRFELFATDTRNALTKRNQELVRSSVEQAAGNMIRLLGAAENAVQQMTASLEAPKRISRRGTVPLEREFYPGGKLIGSLKKSDGYQAAVTFEYAQIKTSDALDRQNLSELWPSFMATTKPLHNFHPELKWLYMGTARGSFLVFPTSPEIPAGYDPRTRPWYREAIEQGRLVWTSPYFTAGGNDLVLTATQPIRYGRYAGSVVGVDLVMADVINNLLATPFCANCTFYLVNQSGEILGKRGDKAMGETWTKAPETRRFSDDLTGLLPQSVAKQVTDWIHFEDNNSESAVPSLSRSPKARTLTLASSEYSFFVAPIQALGWKLVGVTSVSDTGSDGEQVLSAIASLSNAFKEVGTTLAIALILVSAGLLFLFSRLVRMTLRRSLQPSIDQITELGDSLDLLKIDSTAMGSDVLGSQSLVREHATMVTAIRRMLGRLHASQKAAVQHEKAQAVSDLARQVTHNMRSPIVSLETIIPQVAGIPENERTILRNAVNEIKDHCIRLRNRSLDRSSSEHISADTQTPGLARLAPRSVHHLSSLIEHAVAEKRAQLPVNSGIEIIAPADHDSYGVFALVESITFRTVLSNLINNAIEALPPTGGRVAITLKSKDEKAILCVSDNGQGISAEHFDRLGEAGYSFGKVDGTGQGLHHAKSTVEAWGGELKVKSSAGSGTEVITTLPLASPPQWFVSTLEIKPESIVVVVDDEDLVHQIWDYRLNHELSSERCIFQVVHLKSRQELRVWVQQNPSLLSRTQFLVDYEFSGDTKNGLDIIEELHINTRAILVTGRFDESYVVDRANWLQVRILPKPLAGLVPLQVDVELISCEGRGARP